MAKTIRFGDLVRNYGRPEPVTLWTDPKHDPRISKAICENRVLTVHQEPTSNKKDFGEIGFHKIPFAAYFVFPRPLPKDTSSRVIGINYHLAEEARAVSKPLRNFRKTKLPKAKAESPKAQKKPKPEPKPKPLVKNYTVVMRRTATSETAINVKAENEERARTRALEIVKGKRFPLNKAVLKAEVVGVR